MLKKTLRLSTKEVSIIMKEGKVFHSPLFSLRVVSGQKNKKFAAIMPQRIAKTAVARNLARRRVYGALRSGGFLSKTQNGLHVALFCKDKTINVGQPTMVADLEVLFQKAHVL